MASSSNRQLSHGVAIQQRTAHSPQSCQSRPVNGPSLRTRQEPEPVLSDLDGPYRTRIRPRSDRTRPGPVPYRTQTRPDAGADTDRRFGRAQTSCRTLGPTQTDGSAGLRHRSSPRIVNSVVQRLGAPQAVRVVELQLVHSVWPWGERGQYGWRKGIITRDAKQKSLQPEKNTGDSRW